MRTIRIVLVVVLLFMVGLKSSAAGITVTAGGGEAAAGQAFSSEVTAKGGIALGAMQFDLVWDPAVLEFDSLEKGKLLAGGAMLESKSNAAGRLSVAWVAPDPIDAEGSMLRAAFKVKGQPGQKTTVSIEKLRAWGPMQGHHEGAAGQHLIDVQATGTSGEFQVAAAGMGKGVWLAIAAGVILLLMLVTMIRGKKRA